MTAELSPTQLAFRGAMANLSAGVGVVTTDGEHGRAGTTVTALCSVTDSPPTMAVCVNQTATAHDAFVSNGRIGINVLGQEQQDVALIFANATDIPREKRFDDERWDLAGHGVPVLEGSMASLVGRISTVAQHGSHSVLFVEIDTVLTSADGGGLVYFQREFHAVG
ncbi:4-hydroxyphenylacetate 3-monooxygenase reductase subunit [Gordonia desulfuricans]|uniref:4-hydroxyphenylacetate 3-monooxygenase reductase subunit n=1 Tax=Gordonia desulfuricans TaxID=89051 RepID=A0A7K3LT07_9ACTN|nr:MULTISPECIES: flavin reductase [Gordonia]EMP13606.2 MFS transporter [Gordonia sp. NB41Y]NDK91151.1 4-hydroxyphenylacetate 3-monooxygenase reductase subunit [Gordonia desulfuricans]WLP88646.1 flavin reductase [Gordonia sp. NB41Y]